MEEFLVIIYIIMLIWGILNIILFFKIWGMTNDIREIKEFFCKTTPQTKSTIDYRINQSSINNDPNSKFKLNDIVESPKYNGNLRIFDYMGDGVYNCKDAETGEKVGFFNEKI